MRRLAQIRRRFLGNEGGAATIEFVVLVPVFLLVLINGIEASILMTRSTLLDRGLDMAMRELRLNTAEPPSYDAFRALVCERAGPIPGCMATLQVELTPVDPTAHAILSGSAPCVTGTTDIVPLLAADPAHYAAGAANELMLVRACLVVEPIVPNIGLAALLPRDGGGFRLVSVSAFVQEPPASDATS